MTKFLISIALIATQATFCMQEQPEPATCFSVLPAEVMLNIISASLTSHQYPNGKNLAKDIKALALVNQDFYTFLQSPRIMIALLNSLPRKAQAIDLAHYLKGMHVIKSPDVQSWITEQKLKLAGSDKLFMAIREGSCPDLHVHLCDPYIDLNFLGIYPSFPLFPATLKGEYFLELLLQAGANPNLRSNDQVEKGETSLSIAVSKSYYIAAFLLLRAGANPNIPDIFGETPLFKSICAHNKKITSLLLQFHADPNLGDASWFTPLMKAASCGKKDKVKQLLAAGAYSHLTCKSGKTAQMYAAEHNHPEIEELLKKASATLL